MESWLRSPTAPAVLVKRTRVMVFDGHGVESKNIVERVGASKPSVIAWRNR